MLYAFPGYKPSKEEETHEELKKLIYTGKTEKFKEKLNKLLDEDKVLAQQCIDGKHDEGRGLLGWVAMASGYDIDLINYMIDEVKADVNHQDAKGRTALSIAISYGYIENVKALIKYGADIHLADSQGNTPMHIASEPLDNSTQLIELLCDTYRAQEARPDAQAAEEDVSANQQPTPPPWKAENHNGATPLHTAAKYNIEAMHALMLYGYEGQIPKEDLNKPDNGGDTPLHYAATSETGYNSKYLLMLGADKTIINKEGETAANVAADWDHGGIDWQTIMDFHPNHTGNAEDFYTKVLNDIVLGEESFDPDAF